MFNVRRIYDVLDDVKNGLESKIGYNIEDAAARQRSFYYQVHNIT